MKRFSSLFVDTSGWLAYLDDQDPNHAKAVEGIKGARGAVATSNYVLWELSCVRQPHIDDVTLASLLWRLWEGCEGELLEVTEEETDLAWEIYLQHDGLSPSFADCTNVVVMNKRGISRWLSFNRWLSGTLKTSTRFADSAAST